MSYTAAIDQLNAMAPELLTQPGRPRRKFSLSEIGILLESLGNPQTTFRSVLIAGTNGKGSTAATLASILVESGIRTGLYTSPHLERVNERIRVNRTEIDNDDFARRYFKVHDAAEQLVLSGKLEQMPSFFETLTAMAFLHFAGAGVEIAVLEVGMGGRLDATNIVDPLVSVITDISLDHMEWLGSTIAAIAHEKAGIMRRKGVLVTLPQHPEANQALGEVATELEVRGVSAVPYVPSLGASGIVSGAYRLEVLGKEIAVASPLSGAHQHRNIALAIAAAVELGSQGFPITTDTIEAGIRRTHWPGRLERFRLGGATWILDVAHNPAGAWALRSGLRDTLEGNQNKSFIFSCLRDKPLAELGQILFPLFNQVIFAPIQSARATPVEELLRTAESTGTPAVAAGSVKEAIERAEQANTGLVVISGSVYLVGEARSVLLAKGAQVDGPES